MDLKRIMRKFERFDTELHNRLEEAGQGMIDSAFNAIYPIAERIDASLKHRMSPAVALDMYRNDQHEEALKMNRELNEIRYHSLRKFGKFF